MSKVSLLPMKLTVTYCQSPAQFLHAKCYRILSWKQHCVHIAILLKMQNYLLILSMSYIIHA